MCGSGLGGNRAAKRGGIHTQERPRCHSPGLNPTTRRRGCENSSRPRTPHTPHHPLTPRNSGQEHGEDAHGRGGRHTHAKAAVIGGGRAHRSHTRHSPVSWRQTRCEKERSRGLRHLYTVRPHPRGKGRSQHTTPLSQFTPRRLHQAPVQSPSPPPTSRGPWAMYAQPTDERWAARACSS